MTAITAILSEHGYRTTRPRSELFDALQEATEPLALHDLTTVLASIDRVSIYRTLSLFERLGIITIVHHGWKKRYELAGIYQKHHHHHLVCSACGTIEEISSTELEGFIHSLSTAHHFRPTGHTFEISGICQNCSMS